MKVNVPTLLASQLIALAWGLTIGLMHPNLVVTKVVIGAIVVIAFALVAHEIVKDEKGSGRD